MNGTFYKGRGEGCGVIDMMARAGDAKDIAHMKRVEAYLVKHFQAEGVMEDGEANIVLGVDCEKIDDLRAMYREAKKATKVGENR